MTTPHPHTCHRTHHCPHRTTSHTGHTTGAPINPSRGLCTTCTHTLHHTLTQLPLDYTHLNQLHTHPTHKPPTDKIRATPEKPTPLNLTAQALQQHIHHETWTWAETTADQLGITWDTQHTHHARAGHTIQKATQLLANALPTFLAITAATHTSWTNNTPTIHTQDGLDGALTLIHLHTTAQHLTGHTRHTNHLPTPCPHCHHTNLQRPDGSDTITCGTCHTTYTHTDYQQLCTIMTTALTHERNPT